MARGVSQDVVDELEPARFRRALSHFASGIVVITGTDGGAPIGLTCQSFSSLSLDPPLVLFSVARTSTTWPRIARSGRLVVNILSDVQADVSAAFAVSGGDKFGRVAWRPDDDGLPVLDGTLAHLTGTISGTFDGGDHLIVVTAVSSIVESDPDALPLLYFRSAYHQVVERRDDGAQAD